MHLLMNLSITVLWKLDSETTEGLSKKNFEWTLVVMNKSSSSECNIFQWKECYITKKYLLQKCLSMHELGRDSMRLKKKNPTILVDFFLHLTGLQSYICLLRANNTSTETFSVLLLYIIYIFKWKSQSLSKTVY